jgi:hypothetical protein
MNSLLLDLSKWDLVVDSYGNIAACSEPYRAAQDTACALKLFQGECYYDTTRGVPYWQQILGKTPPLNLLKAYWVQAALGVPGVSSAVAYVTQVVGRLVTGQVQITDSLGNVSVVPVSP